MLDYVRVNKFSYYYIIIIIVIYSSDVNVHCRRVRLALSLESSLASLLKFSPTGVRTTQQACAGLSAGYLASPSSCLWPVFCRWLTTMHISLALVLVWCSALRWCRTWRSEHTTSGVNWPLWLSVLCWQLAFSPSCLSFSTSRPSTRVPAASILTVFRSRPHSAEAPRCASTETRTDSDCQFT